MMNDAVTPHIARVVFELGAPLPPFVVPWLLAEEVLMPKGAVALYVTRVDHR